MDGKGVKGWPSPLYYRSYNSYIHTADGTLELECRSADAFWINLGIDVIGGIVCLCFAAVACEWLVRRDALYPADEILLRRRRQFRLSMLMIWLLISGATLWNCFGSRRLSREWIANELRSHSRWTHIWFKGQEFGWPMAYQRYGIENYFVAPPENSLADNSRIQMLRKTFKEEFNWRTVTIDVVIAIILILAASFLCLWLVRCRDAKSLSAALARVLFVSLAGGLNVLVCEPAWCNNPLPALSLFCFLSLQEAFLIFIIVRAYRRRECPVRGTPLDATQK
jgi:hypothetical protein